MSKAAVLLATYNGEKYISQQLDSLLDQSYKDFICYIHDDGSSDSTVSICEEYEKRYPDKFRILRYEPTGGAKKNFLSLMHRVSEDYILFCDQDDVWLPDKIEQMMSAIRHVKGDFLAFCDLKIVDENLHVISDSFFGANHMDPYKIDYKNALIKGFIPGCTMMVSRGLLLKALRYKDADRIKMHDWWLVLAALMAGMELVYVHKPLALYRQHSQNAIGAKDLSTVDRIIFNVKRIFNGTLRGEKKKNLESPRIQARELYECGLVPSDKRSFVKKFITIGSKKKPVRVFFYLRHFRHVYRLWWMAIWA